MHTTAAGNGGNCEESISSGIIHAVESHNKETTARFQDFLFDNNQRLSFYFSALSPVLICVKVFC